MPTLERTGARILRDTSADIELQVYVGGVATALDASPAPVVTITDGAGTAVVTAGSVTRTGTKGVYTLTPTNTADVNVLHAVWTVSVSAVPGQVFEQDYQVVGDLLFNLNEARTFDNAALTSAVTYPDALLIAGRARISESFEQVCGVAFGRAYGREVLDGSGSDEVWLAASRVSSIRSVKVRTVGTQTWTAYTVSELADVLADRNGRLTRESLGAFTYGRQNIAIEYEHGWQPIPDEVKRAGLWLLRDQLSGTDLPRNAISENNELGNFSLSVPGLRGSYYGLPQVDEIVNRYGQKLPGIG